MDPELEAQIDQLRENKRKYQNVIKLAQTLASQLSLIMQTQRQLGDAFTDLSLKSPELHVSPEFFRSSRGHFAQVALLRQFGDSNKTGEGFEKPAINVYFDKNCQQLQPCKILALRVAT